MIPITAKKARELLSQREKNVVEEQLRSITQTIVNSINLGMAECTYIVNINAWSFKNRFVEELEKAGYKATIEWVESWTGSDIMQLKISWSN